MPDPTPEEVEDFLLSCRYGEVEEVKQFGEQYGWDEVVKARDERGNTALHMCCGNGHVGRSLHQIFLLRTRRLPFSLCA